MSHAALEIRHLHLALIANEKKIVQDLSFTVPCGSTVALVGESGSGKTMTSMAVMGLLPRDIRQTGGSIFIEEKDVGGISSEQYRQLRNTKVSIVMQNPMSAFNPILNIYAHFWETLASHDTNDHRAIRKRANELLNDVGFSDPASILELYPFQMSGGMLQRVMLALALIYSPPLIIADEATSDLDVFSQAHILRILKEHCLKRRSALLLITHDLSVAAALADEVVLIKEGRLIEQGDISSFFRTPQTSYAKQLLKSHQGLYTAEYLKIQNTLAAGHLGGSA